MRGNSGFQRRSMDYLGKEAKRQHTILFVLLLALVFAGSSLTAQPGRPEAPPRMPQEKMESLRVAFMTQELDLSTSEAEKFWPVYREYQTRRQAIECMPMDMDVNALSDAELEAKVLAKFDQMDQITRLNREYLNTFKKVLPARKAAMVFMLEHRFRARLVDAMRERYGSDRPGGPQAPQAPLRPGRPD